VRYVFLLFVAVPILEIALLIKVGSFIGVWLTIGIVIFTAALGSWLLRNQGIATMTTARSRLNSGELPATELIEGFILVVGGVLLLTPGFVTDLFGFACLLPPTRKYMASRVARSATVVGMSAGSAASSSDAGPSQQPGSRPRSPAGGAAPGAKRSGDVIEGEFRRED